MSGLLVTVLAIGVGATNGVARSECFPVERLSADDRKVAEEILLKALDSEALYSLVGDIKAISSGWVSLRVDVEKPDLTTAERYRRILSSLRSGDDVFANLQPFWRVFEGKRYLEGVFYNRAAVSRVIRENREFFGFYGLSPSSHPIETVMAFETDATSRRSLAYGLLFGYPRYAIDFFVSADRIQRDKKTFVTRDFFHVPVFSGSKNSFVYAVPKGSTESDADRNLKALCAPILAEYRRRRAQYIGPGKLGPARLLRDWYDDGNGRCRPPFLQSAVKAE